MAKIKIKPLTKEQEDAARIKHEKSIHQKRKPQVYTADELAEMSLEDRLEFHKLNVEEAISEAKAGKTSRVAAKPLPVVNAAAEKVSKATIEVEETKNKLTAEDNELTKSKLKTEREELELLKQQVKAFKLLGANIEAALGNTKVPVAKSPSVFSARGILSKVMTVQSGGMVDKMLGNREERDQYKKMRTAVEGKGDYDKDFKKMKKEQKVLAKTVAERNEMKAAGYSSEQIAASKAGATINERIGASMEKLQGLVPGFGEKMRENKLSIFGATADKSEARTRAEPKVQSSGEQIEALDDQNKMIEEQTDLLKEIRDNTATREKKEKTKKIEEKKEDFKGLFDGIKEFLKSMPLLGTILTSLGSLITTIGAALIPLAAVVAGIAAIAAIGGVISLMTKINDDYSKRMESQSDEFKLNKESKYNKSTGGKMSQYSIESIEKNQKEAAEWKKLTPEQRAEKIAAGNAEIANRNKQIPVEPVKVTPQVVPPTSAVRVEDKTVAVAESARQQSRPQELTTANVAISNTKQQTNMIQPQKLARNLEGSQLVVLKSAYA